MSHSFRRGDPEKGCAVLMVAALVVLTVAALAAGVWLVLQISGG